MDTRLEKTPLKLEWKWQRKKESNENVQIKKDKIVNERNRKYEKIQADIRDKKLPLAQLSIVQLKQICLHKKKKG